MRDVRVDRIDQNGKGRFMIAIGFGQDAVLTPFQPLLNDTEHTELHHLAAQSSPIPLHTLFFMDARRHAFLGHDLQAIISAVIALEILVSSKRPFIQKLPLGRFFERLLGKSYGLSRKVIQLLSKSPQTPQNLPNRVHSAIKQRNRIVHGGQRVLMGNIHNHLDAIEKSIRLIEPL